MRVELVFNPDRVLWQSEQVIATSDGIVLDRCRQWVNLTRHIILERIPQARVVDLSPKEGCTDALNFPANSRFPARRIIETRRFAASRLHPALPERFINWVLNSVSWLS
jgi:hypothetical protein